jgi:hypothetical protein
MAKTAIEYTEELKEMIELRNREPFNVWLMPQLRATAMNMVILDRVQDTLATAAITTLTNGSMGQPKQEVNPLIDKYDKLQRTLMLQFEALGLNYNTAKGKVQGEGGGGGQNEDPLMQLLKNAK